ncbi:MAG: hypothetical protein P4M11_12385 [Candidatus Pacebacteria bacterium]|nr:hypothetical protein [Candidatus Paceibacterota bacterium]
MMMEPLDDQPLGEPLIPNEENMWVQSGLAEAKKSCVFYFIMVLPPFGTT